MTDSLGNAIESVSGDNVFRVNPSDRDSRGGANGHFGRHFDKDGEENEEEKHGGKPSSAFHDSSACAEGVRCDGVQFSEEALAMLNRSDVSLVPSVEAVADLTGAVRVPEHDASGGIQHTDIIA